MAPRSILLIAWLTFACADPLGLKCKNIGTPRKGKWLLTNAAGESLYRSLPNQALDNKAYLYTEFTEAECLNVTRDMPESQASLIVR